MTSSPRRSPAGNVAAGASSRPEESGNAPCEISSGHSTGIGTRVGADQVCPASVDRHIVACAGRRAELVANVVGDFGAVGVDRLAVGRERELEKIGQALRWDLAAG